MCKSVQSKALLTCIYADIHMYLHIYYSIHGTVAKNLFKSVCLCPKGNFPTLFVLYNIQGCMYSVYNRQPVMDESQQRHSTADLCI